MLLSNAATKVKQGIGHRVPGVGESEPGSTSGQSGGSVRPDRRRFLKGAGASAAAVGVGLGATGSTAGYVGPDLVSCEIDREDDRYLPWDTGGSYGGWRATEYLGVDGGGVEDTPVVFVHGSGGDACNFREHAQYLLNDGRNADELWAVTFPDRTNSHPEMLDPLDDFVQRVLAHTGASEVDVVCHSLGVTGVRVWMDAYDRYGWVDTFVGLNGPNHGVCVCPGCFNASLGDEYNNWLEAGETCRFIAAQCFADPDHPLYDLNLPDETPGDVEYHTVRGFYDPLFYCNPWSPYLDGADNNLVYRNHTDSLFDDVVKADVADWCGSVDVTPNGDPSAVAWSVQVDDYGDTVASVTIQEDATDEDLTVELTDPNGSEADDATVYDFELDDGDVTVDLDMSGSEPVAQSGTWTLEIDYQDRSGTFFRDSHEFDAHDPVLVNDGYDVVRNEGGDYVLQSWELTLENWGELPLYVTEVAVEVDGETDRVYPDRTLRPDERDGYSCVDVDTTLSDGVGTYDVHFELEVNHQLWATGTFDVAVPQ